MTPNRIVTSPNVTNLIEEKHGSDKKEYTTLKKNLVYTMYIMFIFQICFILFYLVLLWCNPSSPPLPLDSDWKPSRNFIPGWKLSYNHYKIPAYPSTDYFPYHEGISMLFIMLCRYFEENVTWHNLSLELFIICFQSLCSYKIATII